MKELSDSDKAEYFQRSYTAADGLWFMKTEERGDFDTALATDIEVWKVLPKIQARTIKRLTGLSAGIGDLREALETKLATEGFGFDIQPLVNGAGFEAVIADCPWHDKMVKAGRKHLSSTVGHAICDTEYTVWAAEFGDTLEVKIGDRLCEGSSRCRISFFDRRALPQ